MYTKKTIKFNEAPFVKNYKRREGIRENTSRKTYFQNAPSFRFSLIHGLGHITERNVHPLERFIWILAVSFALLSIVLINLSNWQRFQENPVVISIERDNKQWNTSFPALTFCPFNKTDHEAIKSLAQKYGTGDKEDITTFFRMLSEVTLETLGNIPTLNTIPSDNYVDIILNSSFQFKFDSITSNLNVYKDDSMWMARTLTEKGVCYTFASKIAKYLDPRHFGLSHNTIESTPSLVGNPLERDVMVQIVNMNSGGSIQIHNDMEVPDIITKSTSHATFLHFKTFEVTALSIVSSLEISSLNLEQRKCQFLGESTLAIRPIYTYNLCRMDCRMRLSYRLCNCVPHFYWGSRGKMYKVCDTTGLQCLAVHRAPQLKLSLISDKLLKLQVNGKGENSCKCFPPCDDTNYFIDIDDTMQWFKGTNLRWGMTKYPKIRFKRDILFGITDLLVATGGSVGLFLGCSVLSFVEIIFNFFQLVFHKLEKYLQRMATNKTKCRKHQTCIP